ncbi:unnamed protein product, partial [Rotaria sordida]
ASTPLWSPYARPYKIGRPTRTPLAPKAKHFKTSVPVRMPLSTNTSQRPLTNPTISFKHSIADSPLST